MSPLDSFVELWRFDSPVTFGNQMIIVIAAILLGAGIMLLVCTHSAYGSVLEKESPPPTNGTGLALSDDTVDTDITVNIEDLEQDTLAENKTQMISTKGANDLDIDELPPPGVTVIITSDNVMVTKNPVHVVMTDLAPDIRDEIIDVAKEQSNGSIIIDLPDDYPNTTTKIVDPND